MPSRWAKGNLEADHGCTTFFNIDWLFTGQLNDRDINLLDDDLERDYGKIVSVIVHKGSIESGHYVIFSEENGIWMENDSALPIKRAVLSDPDSRIVVVACKK